MVILEAVVEGRNCAESFSLEISNLYKIEEYFERFFITAVKSKSLLLVR
jgi:hypothetical protein